MNGPFGGMRGQNNGMSLQEQQTIQLLQGAFESCVVKTAMSGVAGIFIPKERKTTRIELTKQSTGFGMGAAFGLFMSSFEYSGPMTNEELVKQTTRQQLRHVAKDMGTRSYSMAKNFGLVGMIYSGTECCIESVSLEDSWSYRGN